MQLFLLPLATVAGIISFTSPCLPLIPGYLSYVSALPVSELGTSRARAVTLRATLLFVAGFTVVFTALGVSSAVVGAVLIRSVPLITRLSGVVIIAMGLVMLRVVQIPLLQRERRFDLARIPNGPRSAFLLGMAYAFGWAPCIGPVLATILATAAASQTVAWGAILLIFYSLGLGMCFVALALGFQRWRGSLEWLRRHGRGIEAVGGVMLVGVGVLFLSGLWRSFFIPLQRYFAQFGWPPI